jgi:NitT/TauT family transport system substrate-binding protein
VLSGAADIGVGSVVPLAIAHERGLPFVVLFPAGVYSRSTPTTVMMVPKDSPIKTAHDLNGKTIAIQALQSIAQLAPEEWIDDNGGDSKSVHFLELSAAASPAALEEHRVDASLIPEPMIRKAQANARVLTDIYRGLPDGFAITVWFTTRQWADAHPDLVTKLLGAVRETARWANTHRSDSGAILQQNTTLTDDEVKTMARARYGERMNPAVVQPSIDLAARYGLIARGFPASEFIYQPR